MYTFWIYVIGREGDTVITMEAHAPAILPNDGRLRLRTLDEFENWLSYNDRKSGFWVRLDSRDNNVSGWLEYAIKNRLLDKETP